MTQLAESRHRGDPHPGYLTLGALDEDFVDFRFIISLGPFFEPLEGGCNFPLILHANQ